MKTTKLVLVGALVSSILLLAACSDTGSTSPTPPPSADQSATGSSS